MFCFFVPGVLEEAMFFGITGIIGQLEDMVKASTSCKCTLTLSTSAILSVYKFPQRYPYKITCLLIRIRQIIILFTTIFL